VQLAGYTRVTSPTFRGDPQRPESWLDQPGEVLRELPGRRVFRATVGGQRVVIKLYTPRRLRHWLRAYAEAEADHAQAVAERGVPVVEPLAHARLPDGRQILVLREEEGARTLQDLVLEGTYRGKARHELALRVGEIFAALQNAGIRHRDPHAGNLLVRPDGSVLLADAWDLRPGDYLTLAERAETLSHFALFFLTHASTVDLLLFWGAYGRASTLLPEDLEEMRRLVAAKVPDAFRQLAGMRARKVRRAGRAVKIGDFTGIALEELPASLLEELADKATHLRDGPHVLKRSPTAWTIRVGEDYVAKVFLPKKVTRPLRDLIQGTRADRAVEAAEALFHRGLKTPHIAAVLRDGIRSVLLMERVRDARPIEEVLDGLSPHEARETAMRLGRTLRRMHDWGLRHRDLKKDNILVSEDGSDFRFLDLDGIRQTRRGDLDWERRARDLANLSGSLLDRNRVPTGIRLRALDAYLGGDTPPGFEAGEFVRLVTRHADSVRARRRQA
jgi:tRNA A-37 threonylcarbamoyl transferase component Bud32